MVSEFMDHLLAGSSTLTFPEESINIAVDTADILPPVYRVQYKAIFYTLAKGTTYFSITTSSP